MSISFIRVFLALLLAVTLMGKPASSQTLAFSAGKVAFHQYSQSPNERHRIKWSWQLPHTIRTTFNASRFCTWYIERMISYDAGGKTLYALFLNNSSLLDGDHYDCFLKKIRMTVADDGTVIETITWN